MNTKLDSIINLAGLIQAQVTSLVSSVEKLKHGKDMEPSERIYLSDGGSDIILHNLSALQEEARAMADELSDKSDPEQLSILPTGLSAANAMRLPSASMGMKDMMNMFNDCMGDKPAVDDSYTVYATYEEAKAHTMPDYSMFDNIVEVTDDEEKSIDTDVLIEYASTVKYNGTDATGKPTVLSIPKYPKFLELFGAASANDIKMKAIVQKFIPGQWEKNEAEQKQRDSLAASVGYLLSVDPDMSRPIAETDIAECKKRYDADISGYDTVQALIGVVNSAIPTMEEIGTYTYDHDPVADAMKQCGFAIEDIVAKMPADLRARLE